MAHALVAGKSVSFGAARLSRASTSTVSNWMIDGNVSISICSWLQSADIARLLLARDLVLLQLLPRVQLLPGRVQHLRTIHKPQQYEELGHSTVVVRAGAADAPKELDPLET